MNSSVDLLSLAASQPQRYPFLLQSTAVATQSRLHTARYDLLFAFPQQSLTLYADGSLHYNGDVLHGSAFLQSFDTIWQRQQTDSAITDLPFSGGWFVYLGYELSAEIEPSLQLPKWPGTIPVAQAVRIPAAIIYDRWQQTTSIVCETQYSELLAMLQYDLQQDSPMTYQPAVITQSIVEEEPNKYLDAVNRTLQYIRDGDVFQVNLSRNWRCQVHESTAHDLYACLRDKNPAPFSALCRFDADNAIISSSPERLVKVKDRIVDTRPIAGTRPRGADAQQDQRLQDELIAHPKERAEHIMLIDLERNDLGRVCQPGTVQVDELMTLESYAHVHHIVSNVRGTLRDTVTPAEIIRAVFPGGTITGCPKVRCMEIIAELEQTARGPYTGALGYINHNGDMDLNILIRTIVKQGDELSIRAGAGLVADSIAEKELNETRSKAQGMLNALVKE